MHPTSWHTLMSLFKIHDKSTLQHITYGKFLTRKNRRLSFKHLLKIPMERLPVDSKGSTRLHYVGVRCKYVPYMELWLKFVNYCICHKLFLKRHVSICLCSLPFIWQQNLLSTEAKKSSKSFLYLTGFDCPIS